MKKMNRKMIFLLLSLMWGHIQEQTRNFEHLVHETWPRTCGWIVLKLYKKKTKSKNHETYQDIMILYVKAVIKIWEVFAQVDTYNALKSYRILPKLYESSLEILLWRCIVHVNLRKTFSNFYRSLHIQYHGRRSRNLVRWLLFERDTVEII
jgi:hypothetical protein